MKPTKGRIVHYAYGAHESQFCAAIITNVFSDTCVSLRLFPDAYDSVNNDRPTSVSMTDATTRAPGCWFWPPRD